MELSSILFFAVFIESLVKSFLAKHPSSLAKAAIPYATMGIGVAIAVAYDLNLLSMTGIESPYGMVDNVVTGVIIGRGSNFVNDVIGFIKIKSKT